MKYNSDSVRFLKKQEFLYNLKKSLKGNMNFLILVSVLFILSYGMFFLITLNSIKDLSITDFSEIMSNIYTIFFFASIFIGAFFLYINRHAISSKVNTNFFSTANKSSFFINIYTNSNSFLLYYTLMILLWIPNFFAIFFVHGNDGSFFFWGALFLVMILTNYVILYSLQIILTIFFIKNNMILNVVISLILMYIYIGSFFLISISFHFFYNVLLIVLCIVIVKKVGYEYFRVKIIDGKFISTNKNKNKNMSFHKFKIIRYIQFDVKRILFEKLILEYLFIFFSLVLGIVFINLLIPKEYSSLVSFFINSFGVLELQIILPVSLAIFIKNNFLLLNKVNFKNSIYVLSVVIPYILLNLSIRLILTMLFSEELNLEMFFFFITDTALITMISFIMSLLLYNFFPSKISLIFINIIVINVFTAIISTIQNSMYILSIYTFIFLFTIYLIKKGRVFET